MYGVSDQDRPTKTQQHKFLYFIYAAHFVSHLHMLILPPVFWLMARDYGVSYVELGIALSIYNATTLLTQPSVGAVADKYGSRQTLLGGLILAGVSFCIIPMLQSYTVLLGLMVIAGFANSTYHPANYAILSATAPKKTKGRIFSYHTFAGFLGSAAAPLYMTAFVTWASWELGVFFAGAIALGLAFTLFRLSSAVSGTQTHRPGLQRPHKSSQRKVSKTILLLTLMFFLFALPSIGMQAFMVSALTISGAHTLATANILLTAFLGALAIGVLIGGLIAERAHRYDRISAICLGVASITVLGIVFASQMLLVAFCIIFAGGAIGLVMASRDMMVQSTVQTGQAGWVFGFVTNGINAAGVIAPPLFGYLVDNDRPMTIFFLSSGLLGITAIIALLVNRTSN